MLKVLFNVEKIILLEFQKKNYISKVSSSCITTNLMTFILPKLLELNFCEVCESVVILSTLHNMLFPSI